MTESASWTEENPSDPAEEKTKPKPKKKKSSKQLPPIKTIDENNEIENLKTKKKKKKSKSPDEKLDEGSTKKSKKKKKDLEEIEEDPDEEAPISSRRNKRRNSILHKFGKRSTSIESHRSETGNSKVPFRTQSSRYEDRFRNEDKSTEEAFLRHQEKTKDKFEKKRSETPTVSRDEAYDFFTKVYPSNEANEVCLQIEEDAHEEIEEDNKCPEEETNKILVRDILGDKFDHKETIVSSPEKPPPYSDLASAGLYVPKSSKVPMENKLDENKQPFFPEEDGIYIGVRPVTVVRNQNKLEKRIITEKKGGLWFGPDGKFISNYETVQRRSCRPSVFEDSNPDLESIYLPPQSSILPTSKRGPLTNSNCQLEIDILSLVFSHHHLFSIEHFLSNEIVKYYEEYQRNFSQRRESAYERKLNVLTTTLDQINNEAEENEENFLEFKERRIKTYKREVASIRQNRDASEAAERELIKTILIYWKNLRDFRKKQGYSLTNHRIIIHKENVADPEDELRRWTQEIERETDDAQSEFEYKKNELERGFAGKMTEWKENHAARKEALKRQKQREKASSEGFGSAELTDIAADEKLLSLPEAEKPQPILDFDRTAVRKAIEENALRCRRPPGEPRLVLELTVSESGSTANLSKDTAIHDNREKIRRNAVAKHKVSIKVFINGKEACHSSPTNLNQDFTCQIGRIFPIQILQWPENITLQISEGSLLKFVALAEVSVPLCEASTTLESSQMEAVSFKSDLTISHDHLGLGSSVDFPINVDGSEIVSRKISGTIYVRLGWGKSPEGEILCPPLSLWKPPRSIGDLNDPLLEIMDPEGRIDAALLENWMHKSRIDPNDPSNADLLKRISEAALERNLQNRYEQQPHADSSEVTLGSNYFRLDQHIDQFSFTTPEEIENNPRFKLFMLRRAKVSEFKNYKMIPISEKEIPRGVLEAREKKAAATRKDVIGSGNPLRSRSRLYLNRLRSQVSHRFSLVKHRKGHMDIVVEDPIPDSKSLLHLFGEMMPAQRPLRPVRMERQKVLIHDLSGQDIKISLTIVRAFDVPVRVDSDSNRSSTSLKASVSGSREIIRENKVNSYVEARFQGGSARTHSSPGPNPAWNEQLSLGFTSKNNDYSPESLSKVNEALHLHLFDEIIIDMSSPSSTEESKNQIYQRLERKWLGSLSIPFSSIYRNTRIEGTFRLYSPPIVLGYERVNTIMGYAENMNTDSKEATYLNVYITIEPALVVPDTSIKEKLDSDEQDYVIEHCRKWSKDVQKSFPNRKINPFVVDVSGKSILMTRYIKSIDPPEEVLSSDGNEPADQVAWFVSLIPYLPPNALFPGLKNIWPTSSQVINMMVGSESEHAVLLANYFLSMKKRVFLLLGQGIPEGNTAYVLSVEESGDRWLWNSITGERFRVSETFCPLTSVYAVLDDTNIWANIQTVEAPSRLKWDLSNGSDWLLLFNRSMSNPRSPSIQLHSIVYTPPDPRAAKVLKDKLERALRESLMTLRPKLRTSLNFHGNAVLRKLLPGLETTRGGTARERKGFLVEHLAGLQQIGASHKICGFPLHFAFTEIEDVIKGLKSTGVHCNQDPNVEFALAVDVKPYPNTVMSVWVYIASLIKRS